MHRKANEKNAMTLLRAAKITVVACTPLLIGSLLLSMFASPDLVSYGILAFFVLTSVFFVAIGVCLVIGAVSVVKTDGVGTLFKWMGGGLALGLVIAVSFSLLMHHTFFSLNFFYVPVALALAPLSWHAFRIEKR